ncbi:MAG: Eco57I restriction-modification methylase domain-containing protein, partial [Desulfobacterales bacterium]
LDREVAVDPEMLGKVFENMLEVTERKTKGAYYTPREIVHYMCQESLIHYLDNRLNSYATFYREWGADQLSLFGNEHQQGQLKFEDKYTDIRVPKEDLETLIRKGFLAMENDQRVLNEGRETRTYNFKLPETVRKHAKDIDKALGDIRICDPAIGSGAFPVGLLHEIVNARLALAPHTGNAMSPYELKRHAIAECLYGVDIDPSAIDIARLRLWLSLIVDEENYDDIEALPNLDYKIVQGDSLLGVDSNLFNYKLLNELEAKKRDFFEATDQTTKRELAKTIDQLMEKVTNGRQVFDFNIYFSEVWREKKGFDVVIGNPPYVQIQRFSGQQIQEEWKKQEYKTFTKTGDIYCLFYEKGYRLLRDRGVLAYITSNKWMRAAYGQKLRKFLSQMTQPIILIDFSSFHVFAAATVDTNVLIFRKSMPAEALKACLIDKNFTNATPLDVFVKKRSINLENLSGDSWVISHQSEHKIKKHIEKIGIPLKEWDISINYGIKTGLNKAFIIDSQKKNELIAQDAKNKDIIKPVLSGKDLKRYKVNFNNTWLIFIPWHFPLHENSNIKGASDVAEDKFKEQYLTLYNYLFSMKEILARRNKSETGIRYEWYALQRCAASYYKEFSKEKIVWGNLALSAQFSLAEPNFFINAPGNLITGKNIKFLLAILNSSVGDFYIRSLGVTRNGGYFEYKPMFIEKLPIPQIRENKKEPFQTIVDYVLLATEDDQKLQSTYFEQIIDCLVYELYFPDEIRAAGKETLSHIGNLPPLTDDMSEEKKLSLIQSEFDRLYDPRHPVRNRVETLDSVDVVQTIRGALQR